MDPAGISLPIIIHSFNPRNQSNDPSMAAFVNTRFVSWKPAADKKPSLLKDALVVANKIGSYLGNLWVDSLNSKILQINHK